MGQITKHSHTNNTDKFQVVGNCKDVIAEFESLADANDFVDRYSITESPYASVWAYKPGDTRTCELQPGLTDEQIKESSCIPADWFQNNE